MGSVLCAAAPIWSVLLLGRGLQGVGTAGVSNVAMIVLADKVSLKEQAVNTSIFQLLIGIGYSKVTRLFGDVRLTFAGVGPVIGGFFSSVQLALRLCTMCRSRGLVHGLHLLPSQRSEARLGLTLSTLRRC